MWNSIAHTVVGAPAHAWARSIVRRDAELAKPTGAPITHASGPDADRLLILGSPVVEGIGVASYDLSFAGHLARRVAARTGRGVDVEVRGIDRFDALIAADAIRRESLGRFDAVLILGGVTEALSLLPLARYRRNLNVLFGAIAESAPPALTVLLAGIAPFLQDLGAPRFAVSWMDDRIASINAITREACESSGLAQYVEFAPERAGIRLGLDASAVYDSWAVALAPAVDRALAAETPAHGPELDEADRQRALDELGVIDSAPDATVDRIVAMARDMLGVDAASVNFIDHDRQWTKATVGIEPREIPRSQAICDTTIQTPGVHVIEDVDADPTWQDASWRADSNHVRFYAGYPLEAPGGERVGALCVMDRSPRRFSASEKATLRDLALAAQAALWERHVAS